MSFGEGAARSIFELILFNSVKDSVACCGFNEKYKI